MNNSPTVHHRQEINRSQTADCSTETDEPVRLYNQRERWTVVNSVQRQEMNIQLYKQGKRVAETHCKDETWLIDVNMENWDSKL